MQDINEDWYPDDLDRFAAILAARGYRASMEDLGRAWEDYSDSMCAVWMVPPRDDEHVWGILKEFGGFPDAV